MRSDIYLFNIVRKWIELKHIYAESHDEATLEEIAFWEMRIENLIEQIQRERQARQNPSY